MLTIPAAQTISPLSLAWRHTGIFWSQTATTLARHPVAILACASIPAVERWIVSMRGSRLSRGAIATLELLVTLWRVMLCVVVIWAACTGRELRELTAQMGAMAAWQVAIENVGVYLAHHIRAVLWELFFLAVALLLADRIARWLVLAFSRSVEWLREKSHRRAVLSVWRNLILFPIAVIYLVEMARPGLRQI
jgi:small-conductance mechanosensitive channel